jgi:hypothetical protein
VRGRPAFNSNVTEASPARLYPVPAVTFDGPRSAALADVLVITRVSAFGTAGFRAIAVFDTVTRAAVIANSIHLPHARLHQEFFDSSAG